VSKVIRQNMIPGALETAIRRVIVALYPDMDDGDRDYLIEKLVNACTEAMII